MTRWDEGLGRKQLFSLFFLPCPVFSLCPDSVDIQFGTLVLLVFDFVVKELLRLSAEKGINIHNIKQEKDNKQK